MATIPTYTGPQVKERSLEGGFQARIQSDAPFGGAAARQLEQAGVALGQAADAFEKVQEREDADTVFRTETALKSEYLKFEDEMRQKRQGVNAKGLTQDTDKWWAEAEGKFTQGLNDRQRRLLSKSAIQLRAQSENSIRDYENTELERSHDESWSASKAVEVRNAITNPKSEVIDTAVDNIKKKNAYQAARKGHNADWVAVENLKDTTTIHREVLGRMLDGNNPEAARMYYEKNQKDLDPAFYDQIEKKLNAKMTDKNALQKADSLATLPYDKALEEVSKIEDPELRDKTRQRVRENFQDKQILQREQEAEKLRKEKAAEENVWRAISQGKKPAQADLGAMNPEVKVKEIDAYYAARAKATVDKSSGKLHAKEDDYGALDVAEEMVNSGQVQRPEQLERFAPFLRAETFRQLRKSLEKRSEISTSEMERSFTGASGKPRKGWTTDDYKEWVAYQKYITDSVKETKTPQALDQWTERWFRVGRTASSSKDFFPNKMTMGEARTQGVTDFVFKTPETLQPTINGVANHLRKNGITIATPEGTDANDYLYTAHYKDAAVWFSTQQGIYLNEATAAAYVALRQAGKQISVRNVNAVVAQMKGK